MLYTKCIFEKAKKEDGVRISVMSRHTLDDGVTPDDRITGDSYDKWMPELAPKNVGEYKRGEINFCELIEKYREKLRTEAMKEKVQALAKLAMLEDITILCTEDLFEDPRCHRIFLAEECQRYQKKLRVEHR